LAWRMLRKDEKILESLKAAFFRFEGRRVKGGNGPRPRHTNRRSYIGREGQFREYKQGKREIVQRETPRTRLC